jgi:hypothetical protein
MFKRYFTHFVNSLTRVLMRNLCLSGKSLSWKWFIFIKIFHTVKVDLYFLVGNCRVVYHTRRVTSLKCHVTQETFELC